VVEDEPLVAMDIADQLENEGAEIVGPVGNARAALDLIGKAQFDAALLDANLSGVKVDDIAAALTRKNTPFAFVSGYGRDALPPSFASAEVLAKPFSGTQLVELAARLVGRRSLRARIADRA
jgi:CheY-like chemotaxis protein